MIICDYSCSVFSCGLFEANQRFLQVFQIELSADCLGLYHFILYIPFQTLEKSHCISQNWISISRAMKVPMTMILILELLTTSMSFKFFVDTRFNDVKAGLLEYNYKASTSGESSNLWKIFTL